MSLIDEVAELLLKALDASAPPPIAPGAVGFVYRRRGGELDGAEELIKRETREQADVEAARFGLESGCVLAFVRRQPALPRETARRRARGSE